MKRIPKQEYTAEFKEQAVKRADEVGSIARAAEELGLVEQTLRNWVSKRPTPPPSRCRHSRGDLSPITTAETCRWVRGKQGRRSGLNMSHVGARVV